MLTEKEKQLLNQLNILDIFFDKKNSKTLLPKTRRRLKRYGYTGRVAWDADISILALAWLSMKTSNNADNQKLADSIENCFNEYYDLLLSERVHAQIYDFYQSLKEIPDTCELIWFLHHAYNILYIYKKDNYVDLTYHTAEISTENIKLKGNQKFLLDWLLERLQIIATSDSEHQREHIVKFLDVWSEVYPMFWY